MAKGRFVANATRFDPYRNFKFRLSADGRVVAGFASADTLPREHDTRRFTLRRGITHDKEFEQWARQAQTGSRTGMALTLAVHDEAGNVVAEFELSGLHPEQFQALPELDASANAVVIDVLVLA